MDFIKKHVDTVIILGAVCGSFIWMNGKFAQIEKDMAIIKTVLIMKQIMPTDFMSKAHCDIAKCQLDGVMEANRLK